MARILVVDDEVRMATLIRRELEDHGHEVVTAGDGSSALEQLSRGTFDLLLTDLRMPGMDGGPGGRSGDRGGAHDRLRLSPDGGAGHEVRSL